MSEDTIDREQLLAAFSELGVDEVDEALLSNIYSKLVSSDYVTPETLLDIIQSIQQHPDGASDRHERAGELGNDDGQMSMSSLYSEQIEKDLNLFSSLGSECVTRISLINYWANLGINFGEEVLYDLGLNEAREIDLGHLSDVFCEQLSNCHQIIRHPVITVAIKTVIHEIRRTKHENVNLEKERDKFRADLNAANERSAALAVEIDEQNEKQDLILKEEMKMLEQDWMEKFYNVQLSTEKEIEKKTQNIQQLESLLEKEKDKTNKKHSKMLDDLNDIALENEHLEEKVLSLSDLVTQLKESNAELKLQVENVQSKPIENLEEDMTRMEELARVNKNLKDRNDELEFCLLYRAERGRTRKRGRRTSSVSISKKRRNRPRRKNDSVATKRKISPVDGSDDNCQQDSPRGEKLRKSCHSELLAEELSWASVDSPEESPDRSAVCPRETDRRDSELQAEAREILEQVQSVQQEILCLRTDGHTIQSDIDHFKRENTNLKQKQKSLRQQIKFSSESVLSKLRSSREDRDEVDLLRRKIAQLEDNLKEVEEKYHSEKKEFTEKNRNLEESLDMMRQEFEQMENYWQKKIEEERNFYDQQLKSSERTFKELEERIQDYEELLSESEKTSEVQLYTIEEDEQLEMQVTLWETEIQTLNGQIQELNRNQENLLRDWTDRVRSIEDEKNHLETKCYKLLCFINDGNVKPGESSPESGVQSLPYHSNIEDHNYSHQQLSSM